MAGAGRPLGQKALQAINASQLRAVGTRQCIGSPTHAHGQAVPEEEEKQQRTHGPTVSERKSRLSRARTVWAEPNPTDALPQQPLDAK